MKLISKIQIWWGLNRPVQCAHKKHWIRRKDALLERHHIAGWEYKSSSAIGKHPDGVFIIDDIHDEKNTKSDKEIRNVVTVVTDTPWEIAVGTPWYEKDAYHHLKSTDEFDFLMFPVMRRWEVVTLCKLCRDELFKPYTRPRTGGR